MLNRIHARPVFQRLLFAQCWEDPESDRQALRIGPGHAVLCVTSGGCNALALLLDDPARLMALDMSASQNSMLELKIEGIRRLDYEKYLELLGVRPSARRLELYRRLRPIPFWDANPEMIERGVLSEGRFERYLAAFRRCVAWLQGRKRLEGLFEPRDREGRRRFYDEVWDTPQWRACFRLFFSRTVLGGLGLDPKFFDFVDGIDSFGAHFLGRCRRALIELPVDENYFLEYVSFGGFRRAMPPYLRPENFEVLRRRVDRVEIVTEEAGSFLQRLPDETLDRIDFSNIFEWVPPAIYERMLRECVRVCRPGARMTYRNLLVRRERPETLAEWIRPDPAAREILARDRTFFYSNFVAEEIVKDSPCPSSNDRSFSSTCSR